MELPANRHRQIGVDGIPDEVVAEPQPIVRLHEEAGAPTLVERSDQVGHRASHHKREVGHREDGAEHRGVPQDVKGLGREEAEASQDGIGERRGQIVSPGLDLLVRPVPAILPRGHELGHQQGVSRRPREPRQNAGTRRRLQHGTGELGDFVGGERPRSDLHQALSAQGLEHRGEVSGARHGTGRDQQHHGQRDQSGTEVADHEQRGDVRPLQVVQSQGDRPRGPEVLHQAEDRLQDLVPEGRPSFPGPRRVRNGPEEPGDGRPAWIGCLRSEPERLGDRTEGPVSFQLPPGPEGDVEPELSGETERFSEQARLPDSRFALDQSHRSPPCTGPLDQPAKRRDLPVAAHQLRSARHASLPEGRMRYEYSTMSSGLGGLTMTT